MVRNVLYVYEQTVHHGYFITYNIHYKTYTIHIEKFISSTEHHHRSSLASVLADENN